MISNKKGITLIALVITIVVLLILAAVSINAILGNNGILTRASDSRNKTNKAMVEEQVGMEVMDYAMEKIDNPSSDFISYYNAKNMGTATDDGTNYNISYNGYDIKFDKESLKIISTDGNGETGGGSGGASITNGQTFTFDCGESVASHIKEFTVPKTGYYKLEVWGAQGGAFDSNNPGGKGGYSSGKVRLTTGTKLYIYIGGKGQDAYIPAGASECAIGGFNGGGNSGHAEYYAPLSTWCNCLGGGGGATDIRIVKASNNNWYDESHSDWNDDASLLSRMIVAGGGGGSSISEYLDNSGEPGGGLTTRGATQSTGYKLGLGQDGANGVNDGWSCEGNPGCGGGYYGGTATTNVNWNYYNLGGTGGSGYVGSLSQGTSIKGDSQMPTHDGQSTMIGNEGNGYAKITYIGDTIE